MKILIADFETTVFDGQQSTEVWAAALVEIGTEKVEVVNSLKAWFDLVYDYLKMDNVLVYFHNLKFDGSFILDYWLKSDKLKPAFIQQDSNNIFTGHFLPYKEMKNRQFTYLISDMGQWYNMILKLYNHKLEIRDSYKLLPFSVDAIGKSFDTKHKKLSIEYVGKRAQGQTLTRQEIEYIKNDVLVIKEALEIMQQQGHTKMTIGSCCLSEYKNILSAGAYEWSELFPDLTAIPLDEKIYGSGNADAYIRKSYRGGWCYVVPGKTDRIFTNGVTADVNSLYPSMMHSDSGNYYPTGCPVFWHGDYIPDEMPDNAYYFIRVKMRFKIKPGYLPTIQIKHNLLYRENEYLTTSDIIVDNEEYEQVQIGNTIHSTRIELTLTCTDWKLIQDHYYLYDVEILDGCYFWTSKGIFDDYINKYREIKMKSTGATRQLAKLFLNNLYGKMASGTNSSFKVGYLKEDNTVAFYTIPEYNQKVNYIPVGSAITSYARNFTIRAAQQNYYGEDNPGFIYADTDSIHCDLSEAELKGVPIHPTEFNHWSIECSWDKAIFLRQKTYIEHTESGYQVTACGMGKRCKELLNIGLTRETNGEITMHEMKFCSNIHSLSDFHVGMTIPGNLKQKRIQGGVVLYESDFKLR